MKVAAAAHRGYHRDENQDRIVIDGVVLATGIPDTIGFEIDEPGLVAVIDGMGGHPGGGIAAAIAADVIASANGQLHGERDVIDVVSAANDEIYAAMRRIPGLAGMGATIAGALVTRDEVIVFNVGDARVYLEGSGYLVQASIDDRRPGVAHGPITQSLGGLRDHAPVQVHTSVERNRDGRVLLASDGLFAEVDHGALEASLDAGLQRSVAALRDVALAAGGTDNIAVALIELISVSP